MCMHFLCIVSNFFQPTRLFKFSFFPPTRLLGPTLLLDFRIFPTYTVIRTYTVIKFQNFFPPTLLFGLHGYLAPQSSCRGNYMRKYGRWILLRFQICFYQYSAHISSFALQCWGKINFPGTLFSERIRKTSEFSQCLHFFEYSLIFIRAF